MHADDELVDRYRGMHPSEPGADPGLRFHRTCGKFPKHLSRLLWLRKRLGGFALGCCTGMADTPHGRQSHRAMMEKQMRDHCLSCSSNRVNGSLKGGSAARRKALRTSRRHLDTRSALYLGAGRDFCFLRTEYRHLYCA